VFRCCVLGWCDAHFSAWVDGSDIIEVETGADQDVAGTVNHGSMINLVPLCRETESGGADETCLSAGVRPLAPPRSS
jgi:hypothetical protein